jgi:3-hydroxyacyl-CoA dehydrogenase/3-hydroxy-2-methylbutyryl-CoA dehydrogenase
MNCENAVCIVTGAASGLGRAVADELLRRGARVAALDRVAGTEFDAPTHASFSMIADVTDEASVKTAIDRAALHFGAIHVCLNCAGTVAGTPLLSSDGNASSAASFRQVVEVNLTGTFVVSCHAAEHMIKNTVTADSPERGVFINVASIRAFEGGAGGAAYAASKGGIVSMTLAAARELAPFGIRVNTIAPGLIDTPMLRGLPTAAVATHMERVQFPARAGEASEFAALACHIIENKYLNAATIRFDGGLRL